MVEQIFGSWALKWLRKVFSSSEANCVYISRNDGVTAITNTMRRHEESIDVTRLALGILGYISTTGMEQINLP